TLRSAQDDRGRLAHPPRPSCPSFIVPRSSRWGRTRRAASRSAICCRIRTYFSLSPGSLLYNVYHRPPLDNILKRIILGSRERSACLSPAKDETTWFRCES